MKDKGQLLIEVVLGLGLLVVILGILASFTSILFRSQRYQSFNQGIAISGFEKYRNALISIAQTDWSLLDNLTSTESYYVLATSTSWQIATGTEKIIIGNESYEFSFKISNYGTSTIKFVTTTAKYLDLIFEDYFLLPKLNVSY
ncbi:MAG: hypothetical protein KatS3mg096_305 [Candidatus Parcubacteria bacterium]|nr:MAG: hypothetical protein KatS3mg096_305 [Candidatus Parcubacteria bacterium]